MPGGGAEVAAPPRRCDAGRMTGWNASAIPDLTGRTAVVTGANSGLGLVTARELARHGAEVTLACRDPHRGSAALDDVRSAAPDPDLVELRPLDLSDLTAVREFAAGWDSDHPDGLDLLVNNAGIMAIPRRTSADGYELQLATNHLGHFALTGLLLPALLGRPGARVVTVSSSAHKMGRIDLADLQGERRYGPWRAYGQSKLANLLFALELQRRADAARVALLSVAAHPGYTATNLQAVGPRLSGSRVQGWLAALGNRVIGQDAATGALPQLYAATEPGIVGGCYVGPDGFAELRGHPALTAPSDAALDEQLAARLWTASEELTGVRYDALHGPGAA